MNAPSHDPGGPAGLEIGIWCDGGRDVKGRVVWKPSKWFSTDHAHPSGDSEYGCH